MRLLTSSNMSKISAFCSDAFHLSCLNTTLATCDECSLAGFLGFGFILALLGLTIVAINSLVLWQVVWKKNKGTYDKIKASLAVADILAGFQPLVISLYNLLWTMNSKGPEFEEKNFRFHASPQATAGGIFYLFGLLSSLYHLVFLSQQRVYAMRWPLKYRMQKSRTVYVGLGIVWSLAILPAVFPAWFPDEYFFCYETQAFLFLYCYNKTTKSTIFDTIMLVSFAWVLPFLVMTSSMIYSAILIRRNVRRSKRLTGNNSDQELHNKREASMFKTVALMQIGFTITLRPLGLFQLVRHSNRPSSWRSYNVTMFVCFHLAMTNSLVNPIIYSNSDKEFRKSIVQCFTSKKYYLGQHTSPPQNQPASRG